MSFFSGSITRKSEDELYGYWCMGKPLYEVDPTLSKIYGTFEEQRQGGNKPPTWHATQADVFHNHMNNWRKNWVFKHLEVSAKAILNVY